MANIILGLKAKKQKWDGDITGHRLGIKPRTRHGDLDITKNKQGDIVVKDLSPQKEQTEKKQWLCNNLGANKIRPEKPVLIIKERK